MQSKPANYSVYVGVGHGMNGRGGMRRGREGVEVERVCGKGRAGLSWTLSRGRRVPSYASAYFRQLSEQLHGQ